MVRSAFVISDVHLGASSSLLTAIDYSPGNEGTITRPLAQAVLQKLLDDLQALRGGRRIHQCILLGDIFDFSFAPYGLAMQNGRWFFEQLIASDLFEEFVYIPGNHDHHLWQQISEHYYLISELENPPLHYPHTLPANFLLENTFLDRLLPEGHKMYVTYPNYEFSIHGRLFYLHHGHYLQKLFIVASRFLAELIDTEDIEDLEVLNAPFLEFGWYNIGQAYNLGRQKLIDRLYYMFKNHNTRQLDRLLILFLQKIDQWDARPRQGRYNPIGTVTDSLIKLLGPYLLKRLFFKHTRLFGRQQHASSTRHMRLTGAPDIVTAATEYIYQFMLPKKPACNECTFIFGHTHEPEINVTHEDPHGIRYHLYNTGGWVADLLDAEGEFLLPRAAPIYLAENGSIHSIPFSQTHRGFLKSMIVTDTAFQRIRQEQIKPL